jgi:hypothetical protein
VFDISTAKGRKECTSTAYKIAQIKSTIDNAGKELVDELKAKPKLIDAERKKIRDKLDAIKDKVRLPLTLWEQKEEERVNGIKNRISILNPNFQPTWTVEEWEKWIKTLNELDLKTFDEFQDEAINAKVTALAFCQTQLQARKNQDELDKLKKEKEERERKQEQERLIREAAEAAAQKEREKAEREKQDAEKRIKDAEEARVRAEQQAEKDKENAILEERRRVAQIEVQKKQEEERKLAHKATRNRIIGVIAQSIDDSCKDDFNSFSIATAIYDGNIKGVKVEVL